MATTSLSLGEHWEVYIKNEIAIGRYGSASEVVRALLAIEKRKSKLYALRCLWLRVLNRQNPVSLLVASNDLDNEA